MAEIAKSDRAFLRHFCAKKNRHRESTQINANLLFLHSPTHRRISTPQKWRITAANNANEERIPFLTRRPFPSSHHVRALYFISIIIIAPFQVKKIAAAAAPSRAHFLCLSLHFLFLLDSTAVG
jgi:hypothetical protein